MERTAARAAGIEEGVPPKPKAEGPEAIAVCGEHGNPIEGAEIVHVCRKG